MSSLSSIATNDSSPILVVEGDRTSGNSYSSTTPSVTAAAAPNHTSAAVSRADLMNTLNGLLHRLNIPTDMQEGSLMDKLVSLNETNAKPEERLRQEVQSGIEGREQMNKMTAAIKCQICHGRGQSRYGTCGHTICLTCLQQLPRNKCPFCRTNINLKVKFFTSDNDTS